LAVVPLRVAESVTELPTVIVVAERVVVRDLAPVTVSGSQDEVAPLLLASPEYTASKLKDPAAGVTEAEVGTIPLVTVTIETTVAVPAQVAPVNSL
jgi:hypothetical protein